MERIPRGILKRHEPRHKECEREFCVSGTLCRLFANLRIKFQRFQNSFQKTESALKRTTTFLDEVTSNISSKFTQMKKSDSYRSLEEKVGNAYGNVKVYENQVIN